MTVGSVTDSVKLKLIILSFSNPSVYMNPLDSLLKCRFWLSLLWGPRFCTSNKLPGPANAAYPWTPLWAAGNGSAFRVDACRDRSGAGGGEWTGGKKEARVLLSFYSRNIILEFVQITISPSIRGLKRFPFSRSGRCICQTTLKKSWN